MDTEWLEPHIITLTWPEVTFAASVGVARRIASLMDKRKNLYGCEDSNSWTRDVEAACAEMAAAKALGVFWCGGVDSFKEPDLAGGWQVRHTTYANGRLIIRDRDYDEHKFLLVTGAVPTFTVHGWIQGGEAKKDRYRDDPNNRGNAYFVPTRHLNPLPI